MMKFILISSTIFSLVYLRKFIYLQIFKGVNSRPVLTKRSTDIMAAFLIFIMLNPYLMIEIFGLFTIDAIAVAVIYCSVFVVVASMFIAALLEEWRALHK